jgi:hypothetical protein
MPRFFVNPEDIYSDHIIISGEDVKHIRNVLRMKRGENLTLCDGSGNEYLAVIRKFEPDFICAGIVTSGKNDTEPPIDVVLYQGIPRSDRMDFIIQKSVELGVKKIVPVISGRSVVSPQYLNKSLHLSSSTVRNNEYLSYLYHHLATNNRYVVLSCQFSVPSIYEKPLAALSCSFHLAVPEQYLLFFN